MNKMIKDYEDEQDDEEEYDMSKTYDDKYKYNMIYDDNDEGTFCSWVFVPFTDWINMLPPCYNILILQAVHGMSGTWAFDSGGLHSTDYVYKAEMGLSAVRIAGVTSSMLPCHLTQPHNERATEPSNSHLQVEQSNGAPDDYYICNWTAPEWRALTPQSILPNSPPSLFKTCCVDHLSNCQLADLWCVLIVPTYKVIVAVVHNNVLYWVAMWNKLVPCQQHGGMRQILLLISTWGNSDQTCELHLIEVYIPNSGRSPGTLRSIPGVPRMVLWNQGAAWYDPRQCDFCEDPWIWWEGMDVLGHTIHVWICMVYLQLVDLYIYIFVVN